MNGVLDALLNAMAAWLQAVGDQWLTQQAMHGQGHDLAMAMHNTARAAMEPPSMEPVLPPPTTGSTG